MKLTYLTKNQNKYFHRIQEFPPFNLDIGNKNRRGQTLLYATICTKGKMFVVSSWSEYYEKIDRLYRPTLFGHYHYFKRSIKNTLSNKLIQLAYKIKNK